MASPFNLTAQINLRGPTNLKPIISQIRNQLGSVDTNISLKIDNKAVKSIEATTNRLNAMNKVLVNVRNNATSLNQTLRDMSSSLGSVQSASNSAAGGVKRTSQNIESVAKNIKVARTEMEEFGRQSALAIRRFAAFSIVTGGIFTLTNAISSAFKEFINFDRELVRLQQVTGRGATGVKILQDEITNLATSLGVSSSALLEVTTTLAQAGLSVEETRIALKALAKTELAPSFENLTKTTEGAIAAIRQFGLEAGELEAALGSINAVAAAFAVESGDIIAAIQRTGGVFASASKGVSEGTDALNEFIAIFTSVRQTTRESAETIATGLRTIFTRIQRASTIQQLKQFGVELQDLEGKFVGPYEAIRRLSDALNQLDPRDIRFSTIVEELGGFRQIGKVIPLIQQFAIAQQALGVAQRGQNSLTEAQIKAQQSLANQITKVREQFLGLIRDVGQSTVFQGFFKIVLGLTSGLISLASAFKPILPILAVFGAIKGVSAIGQFATGFFGGLKKGGGAGGAGKNIGESISGAKEKQRAEATAKAADAIRLNTDALKSLTSAVQSLDSTIKSRGSTTLASGGKVLGFNRGGVVPGSGKGDKVPAMLEPGEVVINNKAASKYGRSNLDKMNKYSWGGKVSALAKYYKSMPQIPGYDNIKDQYISDKSKFIQVTPENLTEADKKTWTNSKLARWEKFEYLLGRKYRLGPPAKGTGFEFLDFPKARAESKFLKKGNIYSDPDTIKGNNAGTIAGKNFLFANSKGTNTKPKSLEYIDISNTPVTTYWADPNEFAKVGLKTGGKIKKFMAGSVGGVMEQTEEAIPSDLAGLIKEIAKIGGPTQLYDFVSKSEIESILKEKKVFPRPTAKQLVSSSWLTAKTPDLYGDRGKYIEALQEVIRRARPRFNTKQSGIQAQLLRNVQAASGQGYKFGLASIYGPNGELGYSSTSNAKEIEGPDGTKYLTQIIRKSLPERFLDSIRATSQDIAGVPARAAERLQYADIFGAGGPLAFDFDETLVKGADIYTPEGSIDIPGYSDVAKVQKALQNAELTLLGKELQKRINQYPELLDSIRILTARPQSNAPYLASTLSRLGLPIPESKITGVSGGLNKVNNLSELETLIDDNLANVESVVAGGKRAIPYSEPRQPDLSQAASRRSIQVMEGYALEEMVKSLGLNISSDDADPLRPIDYPNGLGSYARYWDMPSNIPTDTKRTNSSSAVSRLFGEAQRFYAKNFALGGLADATESMQSLMSGLYGNRQKEQQEEVKKQEKIFGKIGLRNSGGTVPAMVSNGEAFVPPKLAKKIGYAKLDKMNQADRNGMKGFSGGGGISTFKGPGSGTSDSIGPIGLPQGSYVIREKATKALGLYKHGGNVKRYARGGYIRRFEDGGSVGGTLQEKRFVLESKQAERSKLKKQKAETSDPAEKKRLSGEMKTLQQEINKLGGEIKDIEDSFSSLGDDIDAFSADAEYAGKTLRDSIAAEFEAITGKKPSEAKVEEILQETIRRGGKAKTDKGTITVDPSILKELENAQKNLASRQKEKEEKFGGIGSLDELTMPVEDFVSKKREELSGEKQKKRELEAKASTATGGEKILLNDQIKQSSAKIAELNSVIDAAKQSYGIVSEEIDQAGKEEAAASAQLESAQQALVDAIRKRAKDFDSLSDERKAAVIEEVATTGQVTDKTGKVQSFKAEADAIAAAESAVSTARSKKEAAETKKETLYPTSVMPKINPKIAEEQKRYTQLRAEQAGLSVGGYKYSLAQKLGQNRFNVEREMTLARADTQTMVTGRRRELAGVDVAGALKAAEGGDTSQEVQRVQSVISDFTNQLQKANPALTFQEARDAAIDLATKVSEGKQSFEEIVATNETLKTSLSDTVDANAVLAESFRRTSVDTGESIENLKASVSNRQIEQQAFIQSREGQKFGILSEIAPDLTQKFSKTKLGKGLGVGADFISGKGGRLSKAFAGAGGFAGIGAGIAGGAEMLKQFLPKSVTSDPNTAGVLGALGGAGSGAAVGAQLGSFAGPIGTLIGGVGGAIIGGIQGFFSAKNQAILTNALENVAKTTGDLDQAFKKLEADSSKVNFEGAQKAFGDVLAAGQPIEEIAFAKTGFENLGSTLTGGVDKLSAGFAEGDVGKIVLGGLQTAFGASGLGLITDYFAVPEAQRAEATEAMVGGAGQRNESAARLAETGLKFKSTEELGKIFDNIKTGTGELNPITEQYVQGALKAASGTKQLTSTQKEKITAQAKERAALDAYMKKRKESDATPEQITKEISTDKEAALREGEEALKVQAELAAKQALLARATKEVAVATESLLDVYRRITAEAQRYGDELGKFGADIDAMVANFGGDYSMREVDRTNEQVLGNVSAYSMEEVKAAANATAGYLGNTPEAQNLANQAVAQKQVQDQIPAILRTAGKDTASQDAAIGQIEALLASQGVEGAAVKPIIDELKNKLAEGQGLSEAEIQDTVQKAFSTVGKGLEALQQVAKQYNNTLQQARKIQEQYNKAILQAGSYLRKATDIRLNAELDLAKALGRSPTLEELNKPFDVEIASLTGGLVETGQLAAGDAADPTAIGQALAAIPQRLAQLEAEGNAITAAGTNLPQGPAGDPLRQQLASEQLANIQAIGALNVAATEGRQALEKLANDGTKAANALAKIQEEQQAVEGFGDFAKKVFTAEPQQLAEMEMQAVALNAAQVSGPEFFKSRFNRQQAFAGLEQERAFMTRDEYNQTNASLIRKSFEAQGYKGSDVVKTIAGKDITLDELTKRLEGGIDETDPNVIEFRKATEIQAKANEALSQIYQTETERLIEKMQELGDRLINDFPDIVANAAANAQADAQTKPEVKPKEEPRKPSLAEQSVAQGKAKIDEGKKLLDEAKKERANLGFWAGSKEVGAVNAKERKAREMIAAGQQTVAMYTPKAEAEAAARAQQETAAAEAKKQAEVEAKARDQEQKTKQSQDAIDRAVKAREGDRPEMVRNGQRVAAGAVARPQQTVMDDFMRGRRDAEIRQRTQNVTGLEKEKIDQEKNIAKLENKARAERLASKAAGTYAGPTTGEQTLSLAKQALADKEAEIAAEKQKLKTLSEQGQTTSTPSLLEAASMSREETVGMAEGKTDAAVKTATEGVQTSVAQLQSPLDLVAQMATAALQSGSIYTHDVGTQERLQTLTEVVSSVGELVASGLIVSDVQVLEALNNMQTPFAVLEQMATAALSEGINTKDTNLAGIIGPVKPAIDMASAGITSLLTPIQAITTTLSPLLDAIAAPIKAIAGYFGVEMSTNQALGATQGLISAGPVGAMAGYAAGSAVDTLSQPKPETTPTPNRLELANANAANRVVPAPVPVTMPPQASFTNQQTTTPPTATEGQLLTIDPTSIKELNTFNTNFASYVDKLVTFKFPTIPDVIEMKGNHVVDVRISGAAAFEGLKKDFEKMMQSEIKKEMGKIWDKTGGAMGASPNS